MVTKIEGATPRGSVIFVDGVFYTRNWETAYIPLTAKDAEQFIAMLSEMEELEGRPLSHKEVLGYSKEFDPDTWMIDIADL